MLTVLLATHNGGRVLDQVLDCYTRLRAPKGGWKLVIVNNASFDETAAVLAKFKDRLPLSVLFEGRRGKNVALNAGLAEVEGDLVVLTDDDALVPPGWLVSWREIADKNPDIALFGGKITPYWESPPPDWLLESVPLDVAFAISPEKVDEAKTNNLRLIWGPNMAVRARIFAGGVRFNEQIGPTAGNYIMGSETEFNRRVVGMGYNCRYFPEIEAQHIIRSYQFKKKWLLGRAYRYGKGSALVSKSNGADTGATIIGYPRWMLRALLLLAWKAGWEYVRKDPAASFRARWQIKEIQGCLSQLKKT